MRQILMTCISLCVAGATWAQSAPRSGEQVVKAQCIKCHETGVGGAPKIDDRAAWAPRMKNGLEATLLSAINGHGAMPARGGMASLTDSELRSAILYMFYPAGASLKPAPATAAASDPHRKTVAGMEVHLGIVLADAANAAQKKPSGKGYYYVTISLFDGATRSAIKDAQIEVRAANPVTGGETKKLEPLTVNNATTYGNVFRMEGSEPYTITVQIRRAGAPAATEALFEFRP